MHGQGVADSDVRPMLEQVESGPLLSGDGVEWAELAQLTAGDGAPGDGFGCSVSISGDGAIGNTPQVREAWLCH